MNHQLPEFASPNPATLETVELKLRQLIDYLQAKEEEEEAYRGSCGHVEYKDGIPWSVCMTMNCSTHKKPRRTFEDFTAKKGDVFECCGKCGGVNYCSCPTTTTNRNGDFTVKGAGGNEPVGEKSNATTCWCGKGMSEPHTCFGFTPAFSDTTTPPVVEKESAGDAGWTCNRCGKQISWSKSHPIECVFKIPKPIWWDYTCLPGDQEPFLEALEAASKASGITFLLADT